MKMTLPNAITIFRFILLPVFIWAFIATEPIIALIIFVIACISDVLDGQIARRTHTESSFGRWADPLADKTMTIAVLVCLTANGNLPWYFLAFYTLKEVLMVIGGVVMYVVKKVKKVYRARPIGKLAMIATFCGLSLSFFSEYVAPWHIAVMWVAVGTSIASIAYYYTYCYKGKTEA